MKSLVNLKKKIMSNKSSFGSSFSKEELISSDVVMDEITEIRAVMPNTTRNAGNQLIDLTTDDDIEILEFKKTSNNPTDDPADDNFHVYAEYDSLASIKIDEVVSYANLTNYLHKRNKKQKEDLPAQIFVKKIRKHGCDTGEDLVLSDKSDCLNDESTVDNEFYEKEDVNNCNTQEICTSLKKYRKKICGESRKGMNNEKNQEVIEEQGVACDTAEDHEVSKSDNSYESLQGFSEGDGLKSASKMDMDVEDFKDFKEVKDFKLLSSSDVLYESLHGFSKGKGLKSEGEMDMDIDDFKEFYKVEDLGFGKKVSIFYESVKKYDEGEEESVSKMDFLSEKEVCQELNEGEDLASSGRELDILNELTENSGEKEDTRLRSGMDILSKDSVELNEGEELGLRNESVILSEDSDNLEKSKSSESGGEPEVLIRDLGEAEKAEQVVENSKTGILIKDSSEPNMAKNSESGFEVASMDENCQECIEASLNQNSQESNEDSLNPQECNEAPLRSQEFNEASLNEKSEESREVFLNKTSQESNEVSLNPQDECDEASLNFQESNEASLNPQESNEASLSPQECDEASLNSQESNEASLNKNSQECNETENSGKDLLKSSKKSDLTKSNKNSFRNATLIDSSTLSSKEFSHSKNKNIKTKNTTNHSLIKPKVKCNVCQKFFSSSKSLKRHSLLHLGHYLVKCGKCNKGFFRIDHLKRHLLCHSKENRPFKCRKCDKSYTRKHHLQRHSFTHSKIKPFKCDICDKSYIEKYELRQHILLHLNNCLVNLADCDKKIAEKFAVRKRGRPRKEPGMKKCRTRIYYCDKCEKSFELKWQLKNHKIEHSRDEVPIRTSRKTIGQKYALRKRKLVHIKKSFCCSMCDGKGRH